MTAKFTRISGEDRFSNDDSRDILKALGELIGSQEAETCFYEAMESISKRIPSLKPVSRTNLMLLRAKKNPVRPRDVLNFALFNLGDRTLAIESLVERVAKTTGKKRPWELMHIVVSAYLGDNPDGTTAGAVRLGRRVNQGGQA